MLVHITFSFIVTPLPFLVSFHPYNAIPLTTTLSRTGSLDHNTRAPLISSHYSLHHIIRAFSTKIQKLGSSTPRYSVLYILKKYENLGFQTVAKLRQISPSRYMFVHQVHDKRFDAIQTVSTCPVEL